MQLKINPSRSLKGEITVPGDKSITHRAILFALMAKGQSCIRHPLISGVTSTMLSAVEMLGASYFFEGGDLFLTSPGLFELNPPGEPLDCKNSATTMRLLAGVVSAAGITAALDGSDGLRRRPMNRIVEPLKRMGVQIDAAEGGQAPLKISGRSPGQNLKGLHFESSVASAQVKSCILLAGLAADSPIVIVEPALSRDHTERMLRSLGVQIETTWKRGCSLVVLQPGGNAFLRPLDLTIPGDFSAASFILVAALITPGSEVILRRVGLNPSRTGLMVTLQEMGADIQVLDQWEEAGEPVGDIRAAYSKLRGGSVSGQRVVEMIDEFPIFAIAASFAQGATEVRDASELRLKESDRIRMLCAELSRQGINVSERTDGFTIFGNGIAPGGAVAEPHGDHRLAMSLAVLGLNAQQPVLVSRAHILAESYPEFPEVLLALGADVLSLPEENSIGGQLG
ncbi:MAG: 3-phosphoshikimate 1-carboxyvinyltransferase [Anaerolineae bacterium]|nr:3-phosphoshikimate 1-carboxyvinyltransferase [Anaerolineae bacterium]